MIWSEPMETGTYGSEDGEFLVCPFGSAITDQSYHHWHFTQVWLGLMYLIAQSTGVTHLS